MNLSIDKSCFIISIQLILSLLTRSISQFTHLYLIISHSFSYRGDISGLVSLLSHTKWNIKVLTQLQQEALRGSCGSTTTYITFFVCIFRIALSVVSTVYLHCSINEVFTPSIVRTLQSLKNILCVTRSPSSCVVEWRVILPSI